jgi:hypothetical protein
MMDFKEEPDMSIFTPPAIDSISNTNKRPAQLMS